MVPSLGMVGRAPGGLSWKIAGRRTCQARTCPDDRHSFRPLLRNSEEDPPIPAREVCGQGRSPARMVPLRAVYGCLPGQQRTGVWEEVIFRQVDEYIPRYVNTRFSRQPFVHDEHRKEHPTIGMYKPINTLAIYYCP